MKNKVANILGSDPTLPDVELQIGGETYHLAFDFNAICQAEKVCGVNLLTAILSRDITSNQLRGLLWAALLRENPELTLEKVGSWLRPTNFVTVRDAIITAWFGSEEDQEQSKGEGAVQGN